MTRPTASPPGLDVHRLDQWLRRTHPELATQDPLSASVIAGGRSNLTYRVDGATVPLVLRRPPLGHVLSTAHDMAREHRVIAALQGTPVPVPRVVDLVDDHDGGAGTGTPFFLMEHVAGEVLANPVQNAAYSAAELRALSLELAETLAELHRVDPAAVGLGDFGRPDGYLERQLRRWATQLDASRSREVPALDTLGALLREHVPTQQAAGVAPNPRNDPLSAATARLIRTRMRKRAVRVLCSTIWICAAARGAPARWSWSKYSGRVGFRRGEGRRNRELEACAEVLDTGSVARLRPAALASGRLAFRSSVCLGDGALEYYLAHDLWFPQQAVVLGIRALQQRWRC